MSRYYFDVINGQGPMPDDDGIELPTRDAIPVTAARMLLDLALDEVDYQQAANFKVQVRDERAPMSLQFRRWCDETGFR